MCGIAGIVSLDGQSIAPHAVKSMCDVMAHRGPDDAGYTLFRSGLDKSGNGGSWCAFVDAEFRHLHEHLAPFGGAYYQDITQGTGFQVALGHRRLSIIDLTHYGHQPMSSSDCRYWLTYNGEIYNFRELRRRLESGGSTFRSRSDTEVILQLWQRLGHAALEQLDGMFAFAMYDRFENRLTLARDRFGVKPLYYAISRGHLIFASEIKAILASGYVAPEIAPQQLMEYFTFQNLLGSETLFLGIKLLQPGEFVTLTPGDGHSPQHHRFHDQFPIADPGFVDKEAAAEEVTATFEAAVQRQLVSDVQVGSYLSGGMDSGSIVAVAGRKIPRLMTFTGGFDLTNVNGLEQGFDERDLAEKLSYLLQTEHYDVVLHAGDMPAVMEQLTWHMDDPRVGMCHQNWYVAKLASRFVKVCLAGAGGDELFAGYPWRYARGLRAQSFSEFDDAYFQFWNRLLPPDELSKLFVPEFAEHQPTMRARFDQVMANAPGWQEELTRVENMIQRALHFELKTFLHGFLIVEDRISMAHGLESRVPFLDNALANLACRIRPALKLDAEALAQHNPHKYVASNDGKRVLRRAMEAFLPTEFTQQKKQGFSSPDENWFRGPSLEYIQEVLSDPQTLGRPWFDQQFVKTKLEEHFQGKSNHRLLIWSLLSVELMQRHYLQSVPNLLARSA